MLTLQEKCDFKCIYSIKIIIIYIHMINQIGKGITSFFFCRTFNSGGGPEKKIMVPNPFHIHIRPWLMNQEIRLKCNSIFYHDKFFGCVLMLFFFCLVFIRIALAACWLLGRIVIAQLWCMIYLVRVKSVHLHRLSGPQICCSATVQPSTVSCGS